MRADVSQTSLASRRSICRTHFVRDPHRASEEEYPKVAPLVLGIQALAIIAEPNAARPCTNFIRRNGAARAAHAVVVEDTISTWLARLVNGMKFRILDIR